MSIALAEFEPPVCIGDSGNHRPFYPLDYAIMARLERGEILCSSVEVGGQRTVNISLRGDVTVSIRWKVLPVAYVLYAGEELTLRPITAYV